MVQTSSIVAVTVGTIATGLVAYAIYFDHRRRTDPNFRKQLKRESKRQARAAKEEAEAQTVRQREALRATVEKAKEEGFPIDVEEKEAYFMNEVARGEQLSQDGLNNVDAALCFYRALKVYPTPSDLIGIYDKTVPKPVLDILAEMIAVDSSSMLDLLEDQAPTAAYPVSGWISKSVLAPETSTLPFGLFCRIIYCVPNRVAPPSFMSKNRGGLLASLVKGSLYISIKWRLFSVCLYIIFSLSFISVRIDVISNVSG